MVDSRAPRCATIHWNRYSHSIPLSSDCPDICSWLASIASQIHRPTIYPVAVRHAPPIHFLAHGKYGRHLEINMNRVIGQIADLRMFRMQQTLWQIWETIGIVNDVFVISWCRCRCGRCCRLYSSAFWIATEQIVFVGLIGTIVIAIASQFFVYASTITAPKAKWWATLGRTKCHTLIGSIWTLDATIAHRVQWNALARTALEHLCRAIAAQHIVNIRQTFFGQLIWIIGAVLQERRDSCGMRKKFSCLDFINRNLPSRCYIQHRYLRRHRRNIEICLRDTGRKCIPLRSHRFHHCNPPSRCTVHWCQYIRRCHKPKIKLHHSCCFVLCNTRIWKEKRTNINEGFSEQKRQRQWREATQMQVIILTASLKPVHLICKTTK